ncbi:alpha-scruin-like isoform X3 [Dermacentor albipictus]|uniref:alpha-scruin-like isoform X3 n=1 Tax=Dermacentor albipictus TaxID=60249 RepID=UPI0038FC0346
MSDFEVQVCLKDGGPGREFTMSVDVLRASSSYLRDLLYEMPGPANMRLQIDGITAEAFDGLKAYLRNRTRQYLELEWNTVKSLLCADVLGTPSETKVLLAALSWLEHDYQNRKQFEDSVLACVRFGLLPESVLISCFEAPPVGRMALSGRPVRMQLMEAAFSHYVRMRGRPDLAVEVRKRTFSGAEPAGLSEVESSGAMSSPVSGVSAGVGSPGVGGTLQAGTSEAFLPPVSGWPYEARYRDHQDRVAKLQALVRGYLARQKYAKLHARPKPPALLQEPEETPVSLAAMEEAWSLPRSLQALPRLPEPGAGRPEVLLLVCGGLGPQKRLEFSCAVLGFAEGQIWRCDKLPQPRHQHAATCLGDSLYVLGGLDTRNSRRGMRLATSACFRYRFQTARQGNKGPGKVVQPAGQWERLPDMRHARINHAAVALKGRVYAVAGQDEFDVFLSSVEWYEPGASSWCELPWPLPCRLSACGVAAFRGALHVAGGLVQAPRHPDCLYVVSSLLRWDAAGGRWQRAGPSLPSGRGSLALVEHDGSLYAIGGLARTETGHLRVLSDVIAYNEKDGLWRKCPSLPEPLHACQAFSLGGQLLVVSGSHVLCLEDQQWTCKATLPAPLTGSATAMLPSPTVALASQTR